MGIKNTVLFEPTKKLDKIDETLVKDTGHQQVKKNYP